MADETPRKISGSVSNLTGSAQVAANDIINGLDEFANAAFDAGEAGLQDVLKVVDAAQTGVSNALSALAAKVAGAEVGKLPIIPTSVVASQLTGEAQAAAEKLLKGAQDLANEIFDVGEHEIGAALSVVDEAQSKVSALLTKVSGLLSGK